jgi:hypothetical protein
MGIHDGVYSISAAVLSGVSYSTWADSLVVERHILLWDNKTNNTYTVRRPVSMSGYCNRPTFLSMA